MFKYLSLSFLVSLLMVRMPPFYVFPIIKSSLLTSHSIARLLIIGLFAFMIWRRDYLKLKASQISLLMIYLGYLFFHSVSVLNSVNYDAFLLRYKDVVFPGIFLLTSFVYLRSKKDLIKVFTISLIVNFVYQAIAYFLPGLYSLIGNTFLYEGHREFVAFNLSRGRIFIETYDEIFFPFVFMVGSSASLQGKIFKSVLPFLIIIPTLLSNFRSRLLMLVASVFLTMIAWFRSWKAILVMGVLAIILFVVADTMSLRLWGFSIFDRVLLKSNYDDVQSLTSRLEGINTSFELGVSHPFTGIGMGNYYDNLSSSTRNSVFSIVNYYGGVWVASLNPHNIFAQIVAETGITGLLYYLAMLVMFVRVDIAILRKPHKSDFSTASVIAFWSLFSYSMFNPSTTLTYNTLFWILRSMVIYENTD